MKIAVQLYTFHDMEFNELDKVCGILKRLGFDGVEICSHIGVHGPRELKDIIRGRGLDIFSVHAAYETLTSGNIGKTMEYYKEAGIGKIVIPAMKDFSIKSIGRMTEEIVRIKSTLEHNGFRIAYHHHDWEFGETDEKGLNQMAHILADTDVDIQADIFWLKKKNVNMKRFLQDNKKRIKSLHLKDMADEESQRYSIIGEGILDIDDAVRFAVENKHEAVIIEIDEIYGDTEEWLKKSRRNLLSAESRIAKGC